MRQTWIWALGTAAVVAMGGCAGDNTDDQGGGGGNRMETYDDSNPVTREERTGALLKDVPDEMTGDRARRPVSGQDRVSNVQSRPIARGGEALIKVDVNSASVQELTQVPGINLNLAKAIVANRPYVDVKDLSEKIPSLQPNVVASFDQYLVFGGGGAGK